MPTGFHQFTIPGWIPQLHADMDWLKQHDKEPTAIHLGPEEWRSFLIFSEATGVYRSKTIGALKLFDVPVFFSRREGIGLEVAVK